MLPDPNPEVQAICEAIGIHRGTSPSMALVMRGVAAAAIRQGAESLVYVDDFGTDYIDPKDMLNLASSLELPPS